jgi:hypothetical protein
MESAQRLLRLVAWLLLAQCVALVVGFWLMYQAQQRVIRQLDAIRQEAEATNRHMQDLKKALPPFSSGM